MNLAAKSPRLRWPKSHFAFKRDPRFSYCLHLQETLAEGGERHKLLVAVHGTNRNCTAYRDALAPFADANRYVVLAPLFPVGVARDDNPDGYKYMLEGDIRYDHVLLGMVAEVEELLGTSFGRFSLFGFSGGGHFSHRFLYLQPKALASVSVGAPGGVTLIDESKDFWLGTRNFSQRFGRALDLDAIREVRAQLIVGANDTQEFVYPPGMAGYIEGMAALGRNRVERNATLLRNWQAHGIATEQAIVPGIAHEGLRVLPVLEDFLRRGSE